MAEDLVGPPEREPHEVARESLVERTLGYAAAARGGRTLHEYRRVLTAFAAWCAARGFVPLPAEASTVAMYLTSRADEGRSVATLEQELAAITSAHVRAGHPSPRLSPIVREVRKGIRRRLQTRPRRKAPLLAAALRKVVAKLPHTLLGRRDRALLLVGFAGAFRRSELVALEIGDLEWVDEGLRVTVCSSKTDQEGQGAVVGIPHGQAEACPVAALREWLAAAGITAGPVFREVTRHGRVGESRLSGWSVARIVKRTAQAAGLDPSRLAGHSLRAGLVSSAAAAGKTERRIMDQTRHKSERELRRYIREASVFLDNAAEGLL